MEKNKQKLISNGGTNSGIYAQSGVNNANNYQNSGAESKAQSSSVIEGIITNGNQNEFKLDRQEYQ